MNLVEIASFPFPNDVDVLESLLQKEGIEYELRNQNSSSIIPGAVPTELVVNETDIEKAIALIRQSGFESYLNDTQQLKQS